jgi:hypothetical protein
VDVVADLPTDAQSPEPMQQGKRLLDDPAVLAQPGAVSGAAPGDDRRDTHRPNLLAILVVVVGTVGIHRVRPSSRAPAATAYWRDAWISGMSWVTSLRLPPVSDACNPGIWTAGAWFAVGSAGHWQHQLVQVVDVIPGELWSQVEVYERCHQDQKRDGLKANLPHLGVGVADSQVVQSAAP